MASGGWRANYKYNSKMLSPSLAVMADVLSPFHASTSNISIHLRCCCLALDMFMANIYTLVVNTTNSREKPNQGKSLCAFAFASFLH